jgi:hypothetical protein
MAILVEQLSSTNYSQRIGMIISKLSKENSILWAESSVVETLKII